MNLQKPARKVSLSHVLRASVDSSHMISGLWEWAKGCESARKCLDKLTAFSSKFTGSSPSARHAVNVFLAVGNLVLNAQELFTSSFERSSRDGPQPQEWAQCLEKLFGSIRIEQQQETDVREKDVMRLRNLMQKFDEKKTLPLRLPSACGGTT